MNEALTVVPFDQPTTELQFYEALPQAMVALLERRYLNNITTGSWQIKPREGDIARPLLREVLTLGRPSHPGEFSQAMPHVLAACHEPGQSLVMLLHGNLGKHRLYLGGRRVIGGGGRSTDDYLSGQEGAFKSHFPGLRLGDSHKLDAVEMPSLSMFLRTAPALATITGIPSQRGGEMMFEKQSLDYLVRAIGEQNYALMVAAEAVEPEIIDEMLDTCRHLKNEIHTYVRRTVTRSKGASIGSSSAKEEQTKNWIDNLPPYLYGLAAISHLIAPGIGGVIQSAAMYIGFQSNRRGNSGGGQITTGETTNESGSIELVDSNAEFCEHILQKYIDRLQSARSSGWWRTAIYIAADSEATLHNVSGAVRSLSNGDNTSLDPIRTIVLPDNQLRESIERGQVLSLLPKGQNSEILQSHPLGKTFETLGTCLSSNELAVIVNLPQREIPGVPMRDFSEFALTVPPAGDDSIYLGDLQDAREQSIEAINIEAAALNRHVFVTGMTGYGKTNTCMRLLLEAYDKLNIPFLVIEPAKAEYKRLKAHPTLKDHLRVFSIGGSSGSGNLSPFRLNPLALLPGIPLGRHIDLLKAVFNASFPMFAGMSYVLEEALIEVYTDRGWDLYTSENPYLNARSSLDAQSALTPNLEDLHDKIEIILERKQYGQEIHRNLGAALRSRLQSLMVGNKGTVLNTRRSTPLEEIFAKPTIIELQNLGDDEEKAFMMSLIFVLLYEYAETRQRDLPVDFSEKLQHLTLIEEAHRLLQATRGGASPEVGDPRAKAVSMFTDMLAEMRAYGEGFIIADQIPTKLASETLKNSNLKIIHRLAAPDDRQIVGDCVNLTDWQKRHLNNLPPGLAVVHDERIGEAVLVKIALVKDSPAKSIASLAEDNIKFERSRLLRHAGCHSCPAPCSVYHQFKSIRNSESVAAALQPFFENLIFGDSFKAWESFSKWRKHREFVDYSNRRKIDDLNFLYCTAAQLAYEWIGQWIILQQGEIGFDSGGLSPVHRLQRESAAQLMGKLIWSWLSKDAPDNESEQLFLNTSQAIGNIIAGTPSVELAGCEKCPARCRLLPMVSPHLSILTKPVVNSLLSSQHISGLLASVERTLITNSHKPISALDKDRDLDDAMQRAWFYCLLTNVQVPPAAESKQAELLEELRSSNAEPRT